MANSEIADIHQVDITLASEKHDWLNRRKIIMRTLTSVLQKDNVEQRMNRLLQEITFNKLGNAISVICKFLFLFVLVFIFYCFRFS